MEKIVIVGGGVAGLSCLNALLDKGLSPLLLEAAVVGSPKMCGEFIAPPAVPILEHWGLHAMIPITRTCFWGQACSPLNATFVKPAAAYSRHQAEMDLAARAVQCGGRIEENSPIQTITPATATTPYILHLASGACIEAETVMFATGKFSHPRLTTQRVRYVGFKTHIQQVVEPQTLQMFSLRKGYLGVVPITSETSNVTCLIQRDVVEHAGDGRALLTQLLREWGPLKATLGSIDVEALPWLEGEAPGFGLKTTPHWPRSYWIGDAQASVHPAVGYGFAHSVNSAILAVESYVQHDEARYHRMITKQLHAKLGISKPLHHLLQKPRLCSALSSLGGANHWISHLLLKKLDY